MELFSVGLVAGRILKTSNLNNMTPNINIIKNILLMIIWPVQDYLK